MSEHPTDFQGNILDALRESIQKALPDAVVDASGGGGDVSLVVTSTAFAGKGPVDAQRLVYSAIAPLMKGDRAPVHAIDSLRTKLPAR